MKTIKIKRIYEQVSARDGYRILVDRIWPRGLSKNKARIDEWNKEISPSPELRKWFAHVQEKFNEFSRRYRVELRENAEVEKIRDIARSRSVTLLYGAKDKKVNHAVVLKNFLLED
jgi:uncharacterized protein YeaO (DUF488 family)